MIIHGHQGGSIRDLARALADCPVQLRWGGPQVPGRVVNGSATLLGGLEQLENLAAQGVRTLEHTTSRVQALEWVRLGSPVYGRNSEHTQGLDIILAMPSGVFRKKSRRGGHLEARRSDWEAKAFWTRWQPSRTEWRFHVLRNGNEYNSIARAVKVWEGDLRGEPSGTDPNAPCVRARRLGWRMAHNIEPPRGLREVARRAVSACGYDLGAVDLLETPSGEACVLEVNSRPALRDPYTIERYAQALRAWRG